MEMADLITILITLIIGVAAAGIFTWIEIPILKKKQFGQYIREEGPQSHLSKQGTPTMGGIALYGGITVAGLAGCAFGGGNMVDMVIIIVSGALFGLIGFLDDFIKVAKKHNLGLRAYQKLLLQILFSVLLSLYVMHVTDLGSDVWIPFLNRDVNFGIWYIPFVVFVMVAMTNSVNLTDGLDGLCAGVTAIVSLFFAAVSIWFAAKTSSIYCGAMAGGCIGFLIFNHHPAKIFMGDTGSLALGAGLTAAVVLTKGTFLIPFAGFVFVMESGSVILQVLYFKKTHGKRIFRMAPIHHHFELGGMSEVNVVRMFWGLTVLFCLVAWGIMKIG
ncbi:phospho-N-acetylmuramoyl-pentapeptide-transferase [Eubacterium pyruvativorans]|uniref:phospho-N-acetylmuramoyl-pentapeptide- transferase n=1 Tax=Eubacterium pyruvativorans TaxID=155865 RepID=UPI0023F04438|nr:phospho-N-acetylmuramoyl-pentapeptide-transferase [Eubacterium pyruvativorans]